MTSASNAQPHKSEEEVDETWHDMLEMIDFTSRVAVEIHAPLAEEQIYRIVCSEFAASKHYSANIVLLADDGSKIRVGGTCLPPAIVSAAEKATGLRLDGYYIDLAKAHSWAKVVTDGETVVVGSRELLTQWLPGPFVDILLKILGYEGRTSVLVPIKRREKPVGGLAVSCAAFDARVVPSIEALAAHISSAVTRANDEALRVQLTARLTNSERTLRSLLDAIPESAFLMDMKGTVLASNSAVAQRLDVMVEDLLGACMYDFLPADVAERRSANVSRVLSTRQPICFRDSDRGRQLEHYVYPVTDESGEVQRVAILGIDISDRVRMHQELALAIRLASVGVLSASFAHRIRNPLAVVSAAAQMLQEQPDDAELCSELTGVILAAIKRASLITEDLDRCSMPGSLRLLQTKVDTVLERVLDLQAPHLSAHGVTLRQRIQSGLPSVWGNDLLLQELFHNLALNACGAMPSGGVLEVSAEGDRETGVEIKFRDTGPGMAAADLSEVFDPFRSTEEKDGDFGLELFMARHIVAQHHGTITVASAPGEGTTFSIRLPCGPPDERIVNAW